MSDVRVKIAHLASYYYPDVMVGCSHEDDDYDYALNKPGLIVEVLSTTTASIDRIESYWPIKVFPIYWSLVWLISLNAELKYIRVSKIRKHGY